MTDRAHIQSASTGSFAGRVGHKAGGFISKKFFHPSSFKNQEKLWAAIESQKDQERRQEELMKKRDEERRVELLRQDIAQSSDKPSRQASAFSKLPSDQESSHTKTISIAEKTALNETKRRLEILQRESQEERKQVQWSHSKVSSRYKEDAIEYDHSQVWGSYFDIETKRWGYACCKVLVRGDPCPESTTRGKRLKYGVH
jgi:hypothetical protein